MLPEEAIEIIEYVRAFNEKNTQLMSALDEAGLNDCVYVFIDSIDFSNQKFYVFKSKQGTYIQANSFWGTIDEFKEHLDNIIYDKMDLTVLNYAINKLNELWRKKEEK